MRIKHLLMMLLLALVVPLAAMAQTGSTIYSENFDSYTVGSSAVTPTGWTVTTSGTGVAGTVINANPYSQANSFLMGNATALTANRSVIAQLPTFTMPVNCTKLTFRVRSSSASMGENTLSVGYGYTSGLSGNQTVVLHTCEASTSYQLVTVHFNLSAVPNDAFIFFRYNGKNGAPAQTYWYIDNVFVYNDLQAPTDFAVTDVSFTTATLSWTLNGNGSAQMRYSTNSDFSDSHNSTTGNLTDLEMGTTYYAQVRSRIRLNSNSPWSYSDWSETLTFTTDALVAVPYPGAYHEIFAPSLSPGEIDLPDNHWAGLVSPTGQGAIQMFNELLNPNFPNGPRNGWMRLKCTGTPGFNNSIRLTTALPNFDCPVNLLKVKLLIKPSSTNNSNCNYLLLGYVVGNDLTNFTTIESYNPADYSASEYTTIEKAITGIPANARLALRYSATSSGQSGSYWDVDYNMVAGDMVSEIVPTNFQLASASSSSPGDATFTWDVVTGATYQLQYRTLNKSKNEWSEWIEAEMDEGTYTIPFVNYNRYYVRVRAVGYDDQNNVYYSNFCNEYEFFPGEITVTVFPYSQDFTHHGSTSSYNALYFYHWFYYNASTSTNLYDERVYCYYPHFHRKGGDLDGLIFKMPPEGNSLYTPGPQYAISPKIQDLSGKQLTFTTNYTGSTVLEVGIMTDPIDPSTFVLVKTIQLSSSTHEYGPVYFDEFEGDDAHIALKLSPVPDSGLEFVLKDVLIEEALACKPSFNLTVEEGSVTETSVVLSWENYKNPVWELQYRRVTSAGDDEPWQSVIINNNPYTLTGLRQNTNYNARVRAYCGEDEQGEWSNEIVFITDTDCDEIQSVPYFENFATIPDFGFPQCWTIPDVVSLIRPYVSLDEYPVDDPDVLVLQNDVPDDPQYSVTQSRVYLPKMANLNHLKIRIRAKKHDGTTPTTPPLLVRLCSNIEPEQAYQDGNTVAIYSAALTDEYQIFEFYTCTDKEEGWIELYTNGSIWSKVYVDWIEVTEAVQYDKHFVGAHDNYWDNDYNWSPTGVPTADNNVYLNDGNDVIIPSTCTAEVNAIDFDSNETTLTIKYGGSLKFNQGQWHEIGAQNYQILNVTMEKDVQAYTPGTNDHYCLLAVPASNFNDHIIYSQDFFTNDVNDPNYINTDLYSFDPSYQGAEWRNWKKHALLLNWGYGALYASAVDKQLSFDIRAVVPEDFPIDVTQPLQQGAPLYRWALLGNPYTCNAYIRDASTQVVIDGVTQYYYFPYYITNATGDAFVLASSSRPIKPMEGVFLYGWETGYTHYMFTPEIETPPASRGSFDMTVRQANTRSADVLDRARIQFGEGFDAEHCDIMPNPNRLYIPSDGKQLSVAAVGTIGELPLNFEAGADGIYTLNFENEAEGMSYCHLIDNKTGADIDLLRQPEYTFNAKYSDYPSRFKLIFAQGSTEHDNNFAFIRDGHLVLFGIEGTATLQVIDMLGHVLSTEQFSGSYDKQLQAASGVYVIRLINGENVKTQKIVVR